MALQLGALREALIDGGASPEKAAAAAEEVASYENRLAKIEGDLNVLKWMVAFNLAMTLAILWRVFAHGGV
jgi:hypothetical protein